MEATDIKMKEIINREIYFLSIHELLNFVEYLKLLHVLEYGKEYNVGQIVDKINSKWDSISFKNKIETCYRIIFTEGVEE